MTKSKLKLWKKTSHHIFPTKFHRFIWMSTWNVFSILCPQKIWKRRVHCISDTFCLQSHNAMSHILATLQLSVTMTMSVENRNLLLIIALTIKCLLYRVKRMSEGRSDLGHVTCLFLSSQLGILNLLATHGTHGCSRLAQSKRERENFLD